MADFTVEAIDEVTLDKTGPGEALAGHDLMSPYVWSPDEDRSALKLLVRVLKNPLGPTDATGVIYAGRSRDGLAFEMEDQPAIVPGPDFVDAGGVEDPTVVIAHGGELLVFYTGVDGKREQGSLLIARGSHLTSLRKQQVLLKAPEGEGNIKEATVAVGADGKLRLFYEYAKDNASRIGMAIADGPDGPWTVVEDPFPIRPGEWDNWHLSTGPIVARKGHDPVMFYNGATADARWRIGWVTFDQNYQTVTDRCIQPLIAPPPPPDRSGTDIAFAASTLDDGHMISLYFSFADRILRRASVRMFK